MKIAAIRAATVAGLVIVATLAADGALAQEIALPTPRSGRTAPSSWFERVQRSPRTIDLLRPSFGSVAFVRQGTMRLLVVPALFSDSPVPPYDGAAIQRALLDGPSDHGTISAAYAEYSGGIFNITGAVSPWVRTMITLADAVGSEYGLGEDSRVGEYLVQALTAADSVMDFGLFDNNGPDGIPNSADDDGRVDAMAFLFLEGAASCGGPGIWPHFWGISGWTGSPYLSADLRPNGQPIQIDAYTIQDATNCSGTNLPTPSVLAHELGHRIGLPDLYDARLGLEAQHRRWVVGCWDLMSAGSWGCGQGPATRRPPHMSAWSKRQMGWLSWVMAGGDPPDPDGVRDAEFVINVGSGTAAPRALMVPLGGTEYLLLEYRKRERYDAELAGDGVLMFHVDSAKPFLPCATCPDVYGIWTMEADGNATLRRTAADGGNRGEAGDAFTSLVAPLTNATNPSMRRNDGAPATVTIHGITLDPAAGTARIRVTTAPTPALASAAALEDWMALTAGTRAIRFNGGALPYTWTVTGLPDGVTSVPGPESVALSGVPRDPGSFTIHVSVRDLRAQTATADVTLVVVEPLITAARSVQPLLLDGSNPLTAAEQQMMDQEGNRNGKYDVGDLRAYLRRNPGS